MRCTTFPFKAPIDAFGEATTARIVSAITKAIIVSCSEQIHRGRGTERDAACSRRVNGARENTFKAQQPRIQPQSASARAQAQLQPATPPIAAGAKVI